VGRPHVRFALGDEALTKWLVIVAVLALPANYKGLQRPTTQADLIRAFAFGRCLAAAYPQAPFANDAVWSAGMYREIGTLGISAYDDAVKLIPKDPETLTVYEHHKIAVFKCLEFYESRS
jgi:hypothetical protein